MKRLQSFIAENSLYSTPAEKTAFTTDDKSVVDAFLVGFIGAVALYGAAKDNTKIKKYFMSDKKLRIQSMDDDNNDSSLAIKHMAERGFFKLATTPNEMTRFLVKMKQGQIKDIDPNILKGWLDGVKSDKLKAASPGFRKVTQDFIDGKLGMNKFAQVIRYKAKKHAKWNTLEIVQLSMGVRVDPDPAPSTSTQSPAVAPTPATTSTSTPTPVAPPVASPAPATPIGITTSAILKAIGDPNLDLIKGNGYFYFAYDDGKKYETTSIYVNNLSSLTLSTWADEGRQFVEKMKAQAAPTPISGPIKVSVYSNNPAIDKSKLIGIEGSNMQSARDDIIKIDNPERKYKIAKSYRSRLIQSVMDYVYSNPSDSDKEDAKNAIEKVFKFLDTQSPITGKELYDALIPTISVSRGHLTYRTEMYIAKLINKLVAITSAGYTSLVDDMIFSKAVTGKYEIFLTALYNEITRLAITNKSGLRTFDQLNANTKDYDDILKILSKQKFDTTIASWDRLYAMFKNDVPTGRQILMDMASTGIQNLRYSTNVNVFLDNGVLKARLPIDKGIVGLDGLPLVDDDTNNVIKAICKHFNVEISEDNDPIKLLFTPGVFSLQDYGAKLNTLSKEERAEFIKRIKELGQDRAKFKAWEESMGVKSFMLRFITQRNVSKEIIEIYNEYLKYTSDPDYVITTPSGYGYGGSTYAERVSDKTLKIMYKNVIDDGKLTKIDSYDFIYYVNNIRPSFSADIKKTFMNLYLVQLAQTISNVASNGYTSNRDALGYPDATLGMLKTLADTLPEYKKSLIDAYFDALDAGVSTYRLNNGMVDYTYRDFSPEQKKKLMDKYIESIEVDGISVDNAKNVFPKKWISDEFVNDLPNKYKSVTLFLSDGVSDKKKMIEDFMATENGKINTIKYMENQFAEGSGNKQTTELFAVFLDTDKISDAEFFKMIDANMKSLFSFDNSSYAYYQFRTSSVNRYFTQLESHGDDETMNNRAMYMFEQMMKTLDEGANKRKKEYKDTILIAQRAFIKFVDSNRRRAEVLYENTSPSMKRRLAGSYLIRKNFAKNAEDALHNSPIQPYYKLTKKDLKKILRFNNVSSDEVTLPAKHIKTLKAMDDYVRLHGDTHKVIEDLHIEKSDLTSKDLVQFTADMHRRYRANVHSNAGMLFKRAFKVSIPMQEKRQKEWIEKDPSQEIIKPMFHGCDSVAASMILRYGYKVVPSGDKNVTGRMLGDGIYGANHIDKSQQYLMPKGVTNRYGQKGYLFFNVAALGKLNVDYRTMGHGNDGIRSPEWCVKTDVNGQMKIYYAFEIEIISPSTVQTILSENPEKNGSTAIIEDHKELSRFKKFLREMTMKEETEREELENPTKQEIISTFTFISADIPQSRDEDVDFEEFQPPNANISFEPSAYGPTIVVRGTEKSEDYMFTDPYDLKVNHYDVWEKLMRYYDGELILPVEEKN